MTEKIENGGEGGGGGRERRIPGDAKLTLCASVSHFPTTHWMKNLRGKIFRLQQIFSTLAQKPQFNGASDARGLQRSFKWGSLINLDTSHFRYCDKGHPLIVS